jgi:hypothetical protein
VQNVEASAALLNVANVAFRMIDGAAAWWNKPTSLIRDNPPVLTFKDEKLN